MDIKTRIKLMNSVEYIIDSPDTYVFDKEIRQLKRMRGQIINVITKEDFEKGTKKAYGTIIDLTEDIPINIFELPEDREDPYGYNFELIEVFLSTLSKRKFTANERILLDRNLREIYKDIQRKCLYKMYDGNKLSEEDELITFDELINKIKLYKDKEYPNCGKYVITKMVNTIYDATDKYPGLNNKTNIPDNKCVTLIINPDDITFAACLNYLLKMMYKNIKKYANKVWVFLNFDIARVPDEYGAINILECFARRCRVHSVFLSILQSSTNCKYTEIFCPLAAAFEISSKSDIDLQWLVDRKAIQEEHKNFLEENCYNRIEVAGNDIRRIRKGWRLF